MRQCLPLLVASLLACGDAEPLGDLGASCQVERRLPAPWSDDLDVLIVIDSSEAMSQHAAKLDALVQTFGDALDFAPLGRPSLQLAVIAADATSPRFLRGPECLSDDVQFAYDLREPWWRCGDSRADRCGAANYDGALAETTRCLTGIGFSGSKDARPLDAIHTVLADPAPGSEGFRRLGAPLAIIMITTSDDESDGDVQSYIDELEGLSRLVYRAAVAPVDSPRLRSYVGQRGTFVDIDADDWSDIVVPLVDTFADLLAVPCLPETTVRDDLDRFNPGAQFDCVAELTGQATSVPACQMLSPTRPHPQTQLPCYWLEPVELDSSCDYAPRLELANSGVGESLSLACASTCTAD